MDFEWKYAGSYIKKGGLVVSKGRFDILVELMKAKMGGREWIALSPKRHGNLTKLILKDLIFKSVGKDGVKYAITLRGERVLKDVCTRVHYHDGLCPRCRDQPKRDKGGYCHTCDRELSLARYHNFRVAGMSRIKAGSCTRCDRPRHVSATGFIHSTFCYEHMREYWRGKSMKHRTKKRALYDGSKGCKICGEAVHVTAKQVYTVCLAHYRERLKLKSQKVKAKRFERKLAGYKAHSNNYENGGEYASRNA